MDLISWSLNAIDTIFSKRSTGSGEPDCPAGTYAAGYTMDGWEKWRVVCLAALSVEDIEDIYLFGTLITGLMLIGLGIALVYRKLKKTVTAAQDPTRLAGMIGGVGRAVGTQTMAIDRKLDDITGTMDRRFETMDRRFDNITVTMACKFDNITGTIDHRFDNITEKLTALQRILDGGDQRGH